MYILLFLVAAVILWHFIAERGLDRPSPRFRSEPRAVSTDPAWARIIEEHCESPAETAFLRAMIKAFDLQPGGGPLFGRGLRLDLQVAEGPYRADFLADTWLVIEIDGAAWHSSPEAVARDETRDRYFESLGYSVLRISAKLVFDHPDSAVRLVRSALQVGKRTMPEVAPKSGWQRLSETAAAIGEAYGEVQKSLHQRALVDRAVRDAKAAFASERRAIEAAFEMAVGNLEAQAWLQDQDAQTVASYHDAAASLTDAFANDDRERNAPAVPAVSVAAFPGAPPSHADPEQDARIRAAYRDIAKEREVFLEEHRRRLRRHPGLAPFVEESLGKLDCRSCSALLR